MCFPITSAWTGSSCCGRVSNSTIRHHSTFHPYMSLMANLKGNEAVITKWMVGRLCLFKRETWWLSRFKPTVHISKSGQLGRVTKRQEEMWATTGRAPGTRGPPFWRTQIWILFLDWVTWACYLGFLRLGFLIDNLIIVPKAYVYGFVWGTGEALGIK